ncbi:MAG: tRNA (adenosine(37)-N6)-dimethylallyltransferase MiaA [Candidatus Pacebacteria bacterium]|nr:tRNA (adenosine(37)-N6)-dimethylallyltransferase MiaA [Candidatus Paceibacterota bacterium]
MQNILFIVGPTSSGKTATALYLHQKIPSMLFSADSRQVYKEMDIGTGKDVPPDGTHIDGISLINPDEEWSVSHFEKMVTPWIKHVWNSKKLPIIVGGTGLYLRSLLNPFSTIHVPQNPALRQDLEQKPISELYEILAKHNVKKLNTMNASDRNNPRRLIRAIEVAQSGHGVQRLPVLSFLPKIIGLHVSNELLEKRISERVRARFKQGMVAETKLLIQKYRDWMLPAFSATGYREVRMFLEKKITQHECMKLWVLHEIQYAKRQITWFKKMKMVEWYDVENPSVYLDIENNVKNWYDIL